METRKRYVLQKRWRDWEPWKLVPGEYGTVEEAETARKQKAFPSQYRIAEAYTVTRYKAAKE